MSSKSDICVVIPAYNEERVISYVLAEVTQLPYTIIFVVDGSSDCTLHLAKHFPIIVLKHACNLGQGAALQTGITYAIRHVHPQYIVTFDADGQHTTSDIPRLLEPLQSGAYDVALGSRFLGAGRAVNISTSKLMLLRLATAFTRITTGLDLTDTHNGLRSFTAEAAQKIHITHNRMAHASEILAQIATLKLKYCEVPVTVTYNTYSSIKGQRVSNSLNIIWDLVKGKIR